MTLQFAQAEHVLQIGEYFAVAELKNDAHIFSPYSLVFTPRGLLAFGDCYFIPFPYPLAYPASFSDRWSYT
jgi:hypothetical protein